MVRSYLKCLIDVPADERPLAIMEDPSLLDAALVEGANAQDEAAYHAKRADEALTEAARLREEVAHLRQGIDLFRGAYLAATSVRPGAKRQEIEGWLAEDRRRTGTEVQTARPDYDWSNQ